ncbi:nucleotidyl transferase AbiEii/AbiGii toxin family protein [Desulfurella sp.]|uniref:nucleotidyl transferase AbiEii/AbiGii toxin family protein n=1 Tax=Desulfurella sp. TaxID=1962857 RepID=UPI0025BB78C7|nr:nucleotidyl transferase AbiEii/AbiGii toxin family protein [Desulfurella sp.]
MEDLKNLKCLLPDAQKVLKELIKHSFLSKYVLVGGSALSLHLCHRKSEDLDFFTYENNFNTDEILGLFKYFQKKEILNRTNELIDVLLDGVKVTFFNAHWDFLRPVKISNFNLATLEQIAIMKTNVLFLRAKYRDYYDLYVITKEFGLEKAINEASRLYNKQTKDGRECFMFNKTNFLKYAIDMDSIKEDKVPSLLKPKYNISKSDMQYFFKEKIKEYVSQTMQKIKENITEQEDAFTKELNERLNNGRGNG